MITDVSGTLLADETMKALKASRGGPITIYGNYWLISRSILKTWTVIASNYQRWSAAPISSVESNCPLYCLSRL